LILYLDTSSLVKLYLDEIGSADVRRQVAEAEVVATSVVAYPEARSAFARLAREGLLTPEELAEIQGAFLRDWSSFLRIRVLERVYRHAGDPSVNSAP
jgi:predicted nucleic acid-binding protein